MDGAEADPLETGKAASQDVSLEPSAHKGRLKAALVREIRSHPFGYGVLAVAIVVGPFLISMIFPQVSAVQAIVGGIAFGVYAAICAVPQKFM